MNDSECNWTLNILSGPMSRKRKLSLEEQVNSDKKVYSKSLNSAFSNAHFGKAKKPKTIRSNAETLKGNSKRWNKRLLKISSQFMFPEWFLDVPKDLHKNWLLYSLPSGSHCMVQCQNGRSISYKADGRRLFNHSFQSLLPGGSKDSELSRGMTLLDCIFSPQGGDGDGRNGVFFVRDVVMWNGVSFYDCPAEFRLFWVVSRMSETEMSETSGANEFSFKAVDVDWSRLDNLQKAYRINGMVNCRWDGIIFIHKECRYIQGANPLMLKWKDEKCEYFVDNPNGPQAAALRVLPKGILASFENFHFENNLEELTNNNVPLLEEKIVKIQFNDLVLNRNSSKNSFEIEFVDSSFLATCKRTSPQLLSKIIFQYLARRGQTVDFQTLKETLLINS